MSQSTTHACASCGSAVPAEMRFCPNCGTPASNGANNSAGHAPTQIAPPPPYTGYSAPAPQAPQAPQAQQAQPAYQPPPAYARPQKNSSSGVLKVGVILLLLLLVLGAAGYFAFKYVGSRAGSQGNNATASTTTPITTTPINATVNYASVDITITNAQQATRFADDPSAKAPGVVRLNIHEVQNGTNDTNGGSSIDPYYNYDAAFALILPGGSKVSPVGYKVGTGPTRKGDQTNWVDFSVPTTVKVSQLTLQIGKDTEAQLAIPLTGQANVSQYQAKQISPNLRVQYGETFWTLVTATAKMSDSGAQADKGMRFIVLSFKIDNPSTQGINGYPPDYIRLQFGGTTIKEANDSIPSSAPGTSNLTGLVSFLVPQENTSFTLILLPTILNQATTQATFPFQFA